LLTAGPYLTPQPPGNLISVPNSQPTAYRSQPSNFALKGKQTKTLLGYSQHTVPESSSCTAHDRRGYRDRLTGSCKAECGCTPETQGSRLHRSNVTSWLAFRCSGCGCVRTAVMTREERSPMGTEMTWSEVDAALPLLVVDWLTCACGDQGQEQGSNTVGGHAGKPQRRLAQTRSCQ